MLPASSLRAVFLVMSGVVAGPALAQETLSLTWEIVCPDEGTPTLLAHTAAAAQQNHRRNPHPLAGC